MPAKKLENMDLSEITDGLDDLSEEDLEKRLIELSNRKDELRKHQLQVQSVLDDRALSIKANSLTDAEKDKLVQIINARGIPSEEKFGTPGAEKE